VGQLPIFYNAKPAGVKSHWYVDYVSEKVTPLYPFGHGLSYTSFEYSNLAIKQKQVTRGERADILLTVENIGEVAGDEVVQLYVHDEFASIPRPVKELKAYRRVSLEPGEKIQITFHLPVDQLAFYDIDSNLIIEAGRIEVMIGSSSDDIRLRDEIEIIGERKMPIKERVFVCPVSVASLE
jgi:beta-glucosidase